LATACVGSTTAEASSCATCLESPRSIVERQV
jgi:hypothetical protein